MTRLKMPMLILLVALALGWAADFLFYEKSLGLNMLIFVLGVVGAWFGLSRAEGVKIAPRNLWLLLPLLFLAVMLLVRANRTLTTLNLIGVLVMLLMVLFFGTAGYITRLRLLDYPLVLGLTVREILGRPLPIVAEAAKAIRARRPHFKLAGGLLRGILLAVPVLAVFTGLLASADTVFAGYVSDIARLSFVNNLPELFLQLGIILTVAWLACGGLVFGLTREVGLESANARTTVPGMLTVGRSMGFVEALVVLVLVDVLFMAFAWVQFAYLFNGRAVDTMHYEVYRDYVRRGFGELLFASFLTLVLILGLRWVARLDNRRELRFFNGLSSLMIGLAGVMLVSAFQRMLAWEKVEFYINTDTRLYVRAFMLWLGVLFVWLLITLWWKSERFAIGVFVAALGWLVTVNLMNPDADVAQYNLERYKQGGDNLSTRYLGNLSEDAVPVLIASLDQTTGETRQRIRSDLTERLYRLEHTDNWRSWPSFQLSRWQAYDSLVKLRQEGKIP